MPSKRHVVQDYETCFPCKWLDKFCWMSGLHPIYHSKCEHPSVERERISWDGRHTGKFIGENTDRRPEWCPIRGNSQAEREAREGTPWFEDDEDKEKP